MAFNLKRITRKLKMKLLIPSRFASHSFRVGMLSSTEGFTIGKGLRLSSAVVSWTEPDLRRSTLDATSSTLADAAAGIIQIDSAATRNRVSDPVPVLLYLSPVTMHLVSCLC